MAERFAWFLSPSGRKFAAITGLLGACGATFGAYFPQTGLIEKHRQFVEMRKADQPIPVPADLQSLFSQTMQDINLNDYYKSITKPFMVFGFEPYHMGSLNSRNGTYVGLPSNFTFQTHADVKDNTMFFRQEPINWARTDAQQLSQSLILSDEAKKYAIGREILMTDNNFIIWHSVNSGLMVGACYGMSSKFNESLSLYVKPRAMRLMLYTLTSLFFWGLWSFQKDTLVRYYECDVDERLAELGESYIKGGIEYYEKLQTRNKSLRSLFEDQTSGIYNIDGDALSFFRRKHMPITDRKEFFEKKLKEKNEGQVVEGIVEGAAN